MIPLFYKIDCYFIPYQSYTCSHSLFHGHHRINQSITPIIKLNTSFTMTGTRTFCCCLPTRLGVLILAPLTFAFALICSVITLYGLAKHQESLGLTEKIFLGFLGSMMAITSLTSLFGFIGAIMSNYKMVSLYSSSLYMSFVSVLIFGAVNFGVTWHNRDDFIRDCRADNKGMSKHDCRHVSKVYVGE